MRKLTRGLVVISVVGAMFAAFVGEVQASAPPVTFAPKADFATASAAYWVALGDVNRDTHLDLVVANIDNNNVSVLLGNGTGGFATKADFDTAAGPLSVALGDVNGDTFLDIAAVSTTAVSVLLGNGAGGFGTRTDYPATGTSIALGDFNGDSHLDMAVAANDSNTVSVLLGNGTGGFGAKTSYPAGLFPRSVAVGDVNGDTHPDLVVANIDGDNVSVLLGNGTGGFGAKTDYPGGDGPRSVAMGDLNGDTFLDLVATDAFGVGVSVLLGDGTGGFVPRTEYAASASPTSVAVGDLNGDSVLDLAITNYGSSTVSVLLGDGTGAFGAKTDVATGPGPVSVAAGDLNGDARLDLVSANLGAATVSVLLNTTTAPVGAITVTPSTGLLDGQTVTVRGSNWQPGHAIGFCQSVVVDPPGPDNCDSGVYSQVTADGLGGFSSPLTLRASIYVPSLGRQVDCTDSAEACVVGAADGADIAGTVVTVGLVFATVPGAPRIIRNATAGNGAATVSWTAPTSNGGSPITGYVVTPYVGYKPQPATTFNSTATTQTVSGLTNGTQYRFRVQAMNAVGIGPFSTVTNPVVPAATVPGAPTIVRNATAGDGSATVSWTAPGSDGGSLVTGYVVTPYVGFSPRPPIAFDSTATTQTVTGLVNGTEYRFRVQAVNVVGTGPYSTVTNPVVPVAS